MEVTPTMRARKCGILCALVISALLLILPARAAAQESAPPATAINPGAADLDAQADGSFKLSPNALQVARIIGVDSDVARLSELTATQGPGAGPVTSLEELSLHQRITDSVVAASLDVDSVLGDTDYELQQIVELTGIFRARHDRAGGTTNLGVLIAGAGLGVVSGVLSFSNTTSDAGNVVGFASGTISTLLSLRSFRQRRDFERPSWVLPNMLADFLSQAAEPHRHYPEDIWAYLESVPAGGHSQATRKQQLLAEWIAGGRLDLHDSPQMREKIALLTTTNAADKKLNFALLTERAAMLSDVRNQVAQMKHDLADLLRGLRTR
jgi:hypothetical protein